MRKPSKKQFISIICFVFLTGLLFTPLKFHLNVYISKLIALTPFAIPSVIAAEEQSILESYQWQLVDKNGNLFHLEEKQGKVILINFWATWCAPCIAELPSLQSLYNAYGDKITFLLVTNDNANRVNAFMKKKGYTLPVYYAVTQVSKALKFTSIPTTFLIDKSGRIVIKKASVANWHAKEMITVLHKLLEQ